MSLVSYPILQFVKVQDRGGNKFDLRFHSTGDNFVAAQNLLTTWADALAQLTQCQIIERGFTWKEVETDQTPLSAFGEGEKKATISVKLVTETPPNPGQTKVAQINIPAPVDSLFLATAGDGANIVDVTNADLIAFLQQFEEGLGLLPSLTLSDYQNILPPDVEGNVKGKRTTRKSTKG